MSDTDFIAYVGIADIHDGSVLHVSAEGSTAEVVIEGYSGCQHTILFEGVEEVEMNEPEGMLLYSLSEMRAKPPLRRFEFTNNNEDDQKSLTVVALAFRIRSN
jgi:hypothetical protein